MESTPLSEERAAQRREDREETAAGIEQLLQHQRGLIEKIAGDQKHIAEVQEQTAEESEEIQHISKVLKQGTEPESMQK